jgi:hypothetical protein
MAPQPEPCYVIPVNVVNLFLVGLRLLAGLLALGAVGMGVRITQSDDGESVRSATYIALNLLPGWPVAWGTALAAAGLASLALRTIDHPLAHRGAAVASAACAIWYSVFAAAIFLGHGQYAYTIYAALCAMHLVMGWMLLWSRGLRPSHTKGVILQ